MNLQTYCQNLFHCNSQKTENCWRKLARMVKADQSKFGKWLRRYLDFCYI